MTVPSTVQKILPQSVHDSHHAREYEKSVRKYKASSYDSSWLEKYRLYHEYCKSVYDGPPVAEDIRPFVDSYLNDGFFAYHDEDTERLCASVLDKLEKIGYAYGDAMKSEGPTIPDDPHGYGVRYKDDSYKAYPEFEQIYQGRTGDIIRGIFGCHFKIFFGFIFKTAHIENDHPTGSQLWHSDGGPGTVLNMFFHITPVGPNNGGTEVIPWEDSARIYINSFTEVNRRVCEMPPGNERMDYRRIKMEVYTETIEREYRDKIVQLKHDKPGLIGAFRNNIMHKGGFTQPGETRIVKMIHIYPSDRPTPYEHYRLHGTPKKASILKDPAG